MIDKPSVTAHPEFDETDFEPCTLCRGTAFVEVNGEVEDCPRCDAIQTKYADYLPENQIPRPANDEIPF
jgi:hypothetical protein